MSIAAHHTEWLSLVPASGPFLSLPVLLQAFPQGLDAADTEFCAQMRLAHDEWQEQNSLAAYHGAWFAFIRRGLGWPDAFWREGQSIPGALKIEMPLYGETLRPDGVLMPPDGENGPSTPRLLFCSVEAKQGLEKATPSRAWNASPATRMAELLRGTGVRLGLVTNGEDWMLVHAAQGQTTSYVSWNATLWNEERLTWRAFISLLGGKRFFASAEDDRLENLFARSLENQQEVTTQLGMQVRRALELLVATFERENQNTQGYLLRHQTPREIYEAALGVMMRLVFLFCAEERGMLPLDNPFYATNYAVSTLRAELREWADAWTEENLERHFNAWCRLLATFRVVYGGLHHPRCPLIAYGGSLFNPNKWAWLEGREPGSDWETTRAEPLPVDNRTVLHLLEALQILKTQTPGLGLTARVVSFRALDIEQIGHVYEGLLDHTVLRAETTMLSLQAPGGDEPEIALETLESLAPDRKKLVDFVAKATGRSKGAIENDLKAGTLDLIGPLNRACGDELLTQRVLPFANLIRFDAWSSPVVIRAGSLFVTRGSDRRSSGTHYTPRSLTEPLVATTLEPLVYRGFSEGVPATRATLKTPRELLDLKICDPACGSAGVLVQVCRYLSDRLVEAWEIAEEKASSNGAVTPTNGADDGMNVIADGVNSSDSEIKGFVSGMDGAIDGMNGTAAISSDKTLFLPFAEAISIYRDSRPLPENADERVLEARRLVADRCLFGVDSDPIAVEMAQLSLWLVTMAEGRPFSFLEHAIRVGDSLAGVDLAQLRTQSLDRRAQTSVARVNFSLAVNRARSAREAIHSVGEDEDAKRAQLEEAQRQVDELKLMGDGIIAPSFAPDLKAAARVEKRKSYWSRSLAAHWNAEVRAQLRAEMDADLGKVKPFHWPLEFPDAFFRDSHATEHEEQGEPQNGGFDAIVGNPPFMGGKRITGNFGTSYRDYLVESLAQGKSGSADLVAYFYLRAFELLRRGGAFGLIATNTIAQGDTREVGLDQIAQTGAIFAANPSQKWPGTAALEVALVHVWKDAWSAPFNLAGSAVSAITPYLSEPGAVSGNPHRLKSNAAKCFQGSVVLGMGFILTAEKKAELLESNFNNSDVLQPYLNGEDINSRVISSPSRWVINFRNWPLNNEMAPLEYQGKLASDYPDCLKIVEDLVKPERDKVKRDSYRKNWWQYAEKCTSLYESINGLSNVLVIAGTSKTVAFNFVKTDIVYGHSTRVFALNDWWQFSTLQSAFHAIWVQKFSSTMKTDQVYSSTDCFETFPFPRLNAELKQELESLGEEYHAHRRSICLARNLGLTKVYNLFHDPRTQDDAPVGPLVGPFADIRQLRALHQRMDELVACAYGWDDLALGHDFHPTAQGVRFTLSEVARREVLDRLLALNHKRYNAEVAAGLHDKKSGKGKKTAQMGLNLEP